MTIPCPKLLAKMHQQHWTSPGSTQRDDQQGHSGEAWVKHKNPSKTRQSHTCIVQGATACPEQCPPRRADGTRIAGEVSKIFQAYAGARRNSNRLWLLRLDTRSTITRPRILGSQRPRVQRVSSLKQWTTPDGLLGPTNAAQAHPQHLSADDH